MSEESLPTANARLEAVSCDICRSEKHTPLFEARDHIYGNKGYWNVTRCDSCGVVFLNPRIPSSLISGFYPRTYYTNRLSSRGPRPPVQGWRSRAKQALLSFEYGYPRPPKIDIIDQIFLKTLGRIWAHSASFRKNINYIPNGKVLDVGCGNGELLDRFAKLGWETYGTEICRESAIVAEEGGHKIAHGTLAEIQYPQETFDAITLWDTLEHIHNPRETLEEIWRICRPGGSVYIYVPNFGSLYGRILRDRWFMFTAPIHYFHYTEQTLVSLLNGCGFEVARLYKPFGDVGLRHSTIPGLNRKFGDVADAVGLGVFFRLLDRILPNGHLLAHVIKNKKSTK